MRTTGPACSIQCIWDGTGAAQHIQQAGPHGSALHICLWLLPPLQAKKMTQGGVAVAVTINPPTPSCLFLLAIGEVTTCHLLGPHVKYPTELAMAVGLCHPRGHQQLAQVH